MCSNELWAVSWCPGIHGIISCSLGMQSYYIFIRPLHRRWNGGLLDSPRCLSDRLSVRPSVCRQSFRNFFEKTIGSIHFIPGIYPQGWVSWPLFIFVFLASFLGLRWPNLWPKMGFPELFEKTIGPIHLIPGISLMGWVSWPLHIFMFLASF